MTRPRRPTRSSDEEAAVADDAGIRETVDPEDAAPASDSVQERNISAGNDAADKSDVVGRLDVFEQDLDTARLPGGDDGRFASSQPGIEEVAHGGPSTPRHDAPDSPLDQPGPGIDDLLDGDSAAGEQVDGSDKFGNLEGSLGTGIAGPPGADTSGVDSLIGRLSGGGSEFLTNDASGLEAPGLVDERLVSDVGMSDVIRGQQTGNDSQEDFRSVGQSLVDMVEGDDLDAAFEREQIRQQFGLDEPSAPNPNESEEDRARREQAERDQALIQNELNPDATQSPESGASGPTDEPGGTGAPEAPDDPEDTGADGGQPGDGTNEGSDESTSETGADRGEYCPACGAHGGGHAPGCERDPGDPPDPEGTSVSPDGADPNFVPRELTPAEQWALVQERTAQISQPSGPDDVQTALSADQAATLMEASEVLGTRLDPLIHTTGDEEWHPAIPDDDLPDIDSGFIDPPEVLDPDAGGAPEPEDGLE